MGQQTAKAPLLANTDSNSSRHRWRRALLFFLALGAISFVGLVLGGNLSFRVLRVAYNYGTRVKFQNDEIVESQKAAVAADDGRCSEIGVSMLKLGGHAVDATVATALCLGVVNPLGSGIGGGAFMVVRSSLTSEAEAYDSRETAPLAASQDMYENNLEAKYAGGLSIGVPGELAGLYQGWLKYGRLPWRTLFQPAIKLAKDGFVVAPYLASGLPKQTEKVMSDLGLRKVYAPKGRLLQAGDRCYNVELGRTLEAIAEQGPEVFYNGTIGENIVKEVRDAGGILTMEDLQNYRVKVTDPIAFNAMGYTILGMPPPSSGTLGLSLVLNILESYGSLSSAAGPLGLHRLIEALKHMFSIRMLLGDPDFVDVSKTISDMLSPSFGKKIRERIFDNTTFPSDYYMPRWSQLRDSGTSHICVVDADRNAVSMTTTINYAFGAGLLSLSTGIILNNEMGDFSSPTEISPDTLPPSSTNFISPNKRPLSSMGPLIVLKDNELAGVVGGGGGIYIVPAVIQVFLNHFVLGMDPLLAVHRPRVFHELIPNVVYYENWTVIDGDLIELSDKNLHFLEERGHNLETHSGIAVCQIIVQALANSTDKVLKHRKEPKDQILRGMLTAVSDSRKNGRPAAI